jgi:hypothetical protein
MISLVQIALWNAPKTAHMTTRPRQHLKKRKTLDETVPGQTNKQTNTKETHNTQTALVITSSFKMPCEGCPKVLT